MKILMRPIEMIAWFDCEGKLMPIRFRLPENHIVINIKNPKLLKEEKLAGNRMFVYRGSVEIDDIEKIIEIKYELSTCKWYLFKM